MSLPQNHKIFLLLFLFTISFIPTQSALPKDDTPPSLILELFRHGSRGPNDAIWDTTWLPSECSSLTAVGARQHYVLGKVLREEYTNRYGPDFLVSTYRPDKVYVRSTDVERTIMSAYSHLYGIFEGDGYTHDQVPGGDGILPPYQNMTLINKINNLVKDGPALPFRYLPYPDHTLQFPDKVLATESICHNFGGWRNTNINSNTYKAMIAAFSSTLNKLRDMGYHLDDWFTLNDFADTIIVDYHENRTMPSNLTWDSDIIQDVNFLYEWGTVFTQFGQDIQKQVLSTPILDYIFDAVNGSVNGTSNLQLVLLSAHDDTLLTALTPLGVVTPACLYENFLSWKATKKLIHPECLYPTFASNFRVEVFNVTIPYVRLYYGGQELWLCNGKASYCTVDQFAQLVKTATNSGNLQTFDALCNNTGVAAGKVKTVGEVKKGNEGGVGEWIKGHLTWIFAGVVIILIGLNIWQTRKCMKVAEEKKKARNDGTEKVLLFEQQA